MSLKLRPSKAEYWGPMGCSGAMRMQDGLGVTSRIEANEGAKAHELAARLINSPHVDGLPPVTPQDYPDAYMQAYVAGYVAYVVQVAAGNSHTFCEVKLDAIPQSLWEGGTPDVRMFNRERKEVHIIDFKYGHSFVSEQYNKQLLAYAALDLHHYRSARDGYTYHLHVYQPRAYGHQTARVQMLTAADIDKWILAFNSSADEATQEAPRLRTGPHCKYCEARTNCAALNTRALDMSDTTYGTLGLSLTQKGELLLHLTQSLELLGYLKSALEADVTAQVQAGGFGSGWMLKPGPARLAWNLPDAALLQALPELAVPKACTPAQARLKGISPVLLTSLTAKKTSYKLAQSTIGEPQ